jgi:hypothetical protein
MATNVPSWIRTITSALGFVVWSGSIATSAPILDQSFIPFPANPTPFLGIGLDSSGAQTFTVGITGILTEIDVFIQRNGPILSDLHLDVRPTVNGVPTANDSAALGSVTLPTPILGTTPSFIAFDFSSLDIRVSQDDLLAIVLSGNAQWFGNFGDPYPRGASFFRFLPNDFSPSHDGSVDVGFRTFVEPLPMPEPCTVVLLSAAIFAMICYVKTTVPATRVCLAASNAADAAARRKRPFPARARRDPLVQHS